MTGGVLEGRNAVVTGASRGLGAAIARALAGAGAGVALVARDPARLAEVAASIRAEGGRTIELLADVRDPAAVATLAERVAEGLGACDILINNAGINIRKPFEDFALDEWRTMLEVNLTGPFLVTRAFLPGMRQRGFGRILNLTSTMSHIALPERTAYATTKHGLLGLTRALALEVAGDGITVNGISPGPFRTDMVDVVLADPVQRDDFLARIPVGRPGEPPDVGALAVFLCSGAAGYITGTDVVIDGGWTAQ